MKFNLVLLEALTYNKLTLIQCESAMNRQELEKLLQKHHIDTTSWEKSIDAFCNEINEGSSTLEEQNWKLFGIVKVAVMFCTKDDNTFFVAFEQNGRELF